MQTYGGVWTTQKLDVVEKYLDFYTTALRNQYFKLAYIDAFSGSGNVELNNGQVIDGSALRALKYPFDRYYFFDKEKQHCDALDEKVKGSFPDKNVMIANTDCNELLTTIDKFEWINERWRGVIFLDPYAMNL